MLLRTLLAAAVTLLGVAGARAETGPCTTTPAGAEKCGTGADALIVLPDTRSPSGKLAVGWRSKSEIAGEFPDPDEVEDHIVRLSDGKSRPNRGPGVEYR